MGGFWLLLQQTLVVLRIPLVERERDRERQRETFFCLFESPGALQNNLLLLPSFGCFLFIKFGRVSSSWSSCFTI